MIFNIEQLEAYYGLVHFRIIKIEFNVSFLSTLYGKCWGYNDVYQYISYVVSAKYVMIIAIMLPLRLHLVNDVTIVCGNMYMNRW